MLISCKVKQALEFFEWSNMPHWWDKFKNQILTLFPYITMPVWEEDIGGSIGALDIGMILLGLMNVLKKNSLK